MKKLVGIVTFVCLLCGVYAGNVLAANYDYADATGYDNSGVYSENPTWNRLGTSWSGEANAGAVANNMDLDDGVLWSINGGTYGNDAITVGDKVNFQFILSKVEWGRHDADYLKAWIDWDNNKTFADGEVIIAETYNFTPNTAPDGSSTQFLNTAHIPEIVGTYYFEMVFDNISAGDYWLRARTVCNADVYPKPPSIGAFSPTGYYYQGEIEDWKLTVNQRVPEPASMLLLGFGLLGLAGMRRKFKK